MVDYFLNRKSISWMFALLLALGGINPFSEWGSWNSRNLPFDLRW